MRREINDYQRPRLPVISITRDETTTMMKHDAIPMLTPELVFDPYDDYPEEVLECEWNPALEQVIRLRQQRRSPTQLQLVYAEPAELPIHDD
jgi:hypothetical protein